tara:strand:- start:11078 stop:11764 length:687 start_codon:yes stop_codon:yes gene_type:complete
MKMRMYRIFEALGDSILLATFIKHYNIKTIYYNRGEFKTLSIILKKYNVEPPTFIPVNERISITMLDILQDLTRHNIQLIKLDHIKNGKCTTTQLKTKNDYGADRAVTKEEAKPYIENLTVMPVEKAKNISELINLMCQSEKHITMDSGTAWLSASMRIPTVVISKNSYYWPDAYHYMKYIETLENVEVYQQENKGVQIATEKQFLKYSKANGIKAMDYQKYKTQVLK